MRAPLIRCLSFIGMTTKTSWVPFKYCPCAHILIARRCIVLFQYGLGVERDPSKIIAALARSENKIVVWVAVNRDRMHQDLDVERWPMTESDRWCLYPDRNSLITIRLRETNGTGEVQNCVCGVLMFLGSSTKYLVRYPISKSRNHRSV